MAKRESIPIIELKPAEDDLGAPFLMHSMRREEENRSARGMAPHRHAFYTIILIEEAEGLHSIDFRDYPLRANSVFFLAPGQVHVLEAHSPPSGTVLMFTDEFLLLADIRPELAGAGALFNDFDDAPLMFDKQSAAELHRLCREMQREYRDSGRSMRTEILGAWLRVFLLLCLRRKAETMSDAVRAVESVHATAHRFRELLEEHYRTLRKVSDYAARLHITANHLNDVVKNATGKSAKELIQERLILEAKRYAVFSDCTLSQIAAHLGYEDPAQFSRFFKRCSGSGFLEFRKATRKNAK